ncbi:ABC transporter permease [Lactobacillus sp. XV13L]|nr:ABC transporter permease [Lactobacillus sp. XV13L]
MWTLFKQDLTDILKNRPIMMFLVGYPPILTLLASFVLQTNFNNDFLSSYDYYGITMLVYLTTATVIIMPELMFGSHVKYANRRIAYAPVSRDTICLSKLLASFLIPLIVFSNYIFWGNISGLINYGGQQIVYIFLLEAFLLLFAITLGGAFCTLLKSEDLATKILNIVVNILAMVSGVFFPAYILGKTFAQISGYSPLSLVMQSFYQIIYDYDLHSLPFTIAVLAACSLLFMIIIHDKYRPDRIA